MEQQRTVDEVCNDEQWFRQNLVQFMRDHGWYDAPGGGVCHRRLKITTSTYLEAMKVCIMVASD